VSWEIRTEGEEEGACLSVKRWVSAKELKEK